MPKIGIFRFIILLSKLGESKFLTELGPPERTIPARFLSFNKPIFILLYGMTIQYIFCSKYFYRKRFSLLYWLRMLIIWALSDMQNNHN